MRLLTVGGVTDDGTYDGTSISDGTAGSLGSAAWRPGGRGDMRATSGVSTVWSVCGSGPIGGQIGGRRLLRNLR